MVRLTGLLNNSVYQEAKAARIKSVTFYMKDGGSYYTDVNIHDVPAGTTIYIGVVNGSSISGTLQYELAAKLSESYYGTSMLLP